MRPNTCKARTIATGMLATNPLFSARQAESRDTTFPLRRHDRRYTTDLRFMARRSGICRAIAVYEFAGVDHAERQLWRRRSRTATWSDAAETVAAGRRRHPLTVHPPTPLVLDRPEVLADCGG